MKLLVNAPSGKQEVIEVGEGGGYFDHERVIWDEREDGELPEITLGGMVRNGDALAFSHARMDEHVAATSPTEADLIRHFDGLVQKSIDDGARALGYGDPNRPEVSPILHAVGYADEPSVVKYQAEGRLLRAFRSLRWYRSLTILQEVKSGERPIPTDAELLADLDEHAPVPTQDDVEAEIARLTAP